MAQQEAQQTERAFDVVTFGETMLRLSAPGYSRLEEAVTLDVRIGGSESNTAVALARLGLRAAWWSKLPANPLGRRIENEIRRWGVDTSGVIWDTEPTARAGLYFLDFGVAPRGIDVYYDRARSAASTLTPEEIDADLIAQARLLHLSGITPALGPSCAQAVTRAIERAKAAGTLVSFDVNYRAKLWTPEEARKTLEPLLPRVDVLLTPLSDAAAIFAITGSGPEVAREFRQRYGVGVAVVTCGGDGAVACDDRGDWAAAASPLNEVVDRVGAGDAFNAGVLMGYLQGDLALGLEYGATMAALKHTMPGDLLLSTRAEIEAARAGSSSGIRR
ncbi:MAG TPA: sugar kinase [Chthonomonadaceae bacterium]|nr:sugar kinase [Chthonomonadaceae bacterium]